MDIFNAPTSTETYKVMAYVDDVKPGITSLEEFSLVDRGSALFEAASGCVLHRDPNSGKVKFLAIGGWKPKGREPGLQKDDIPVPYVALSEHLDMVRGRPETDFPAGYRKGSKIRFRYSRKRNAFSKFRFRLSRKRNAFLKFRFR